MVQLVAIKDGWSESRSIPSHDEAMMVASAMWDSGAYESVSVSAGTRVLFWRIRGRTCRKPSLSRLAQTNTLPKVQQ